MSANPGNLLRELPAVGLLIERLRDELGDTHDPKLLGHICRKVLDGWREQILEDHRLGIVTESLDQEEVYTSARQAVADWSAPRTCRVVNGTGIILHSGVGRAVYSPKVIENIAAADGYVLLEVDKGEGARRRRDAFCEELLCELTGAEAAFVVNNNAAATMIILNTMAKNREVVVSRSQLIEIGGSYRLPDVFEASGCLLREVGTTNKSRPSDYAEAIGENTGALMLVHTSNYRIVGFTDHVDLPEMVEIGKEHGVPVIHDVGSGSLIDLRGYGVVDEPPVSESIKRGADVVCFSGDKLIGGPQAGIIVGTKDWIERIRKNPLARALRIDKTTCIALETTLRFYFEPARLAENVPTLGMLSEEIDSVRARAEKLLERFRAELPEIADAELVEDESQLGAGTLPMHGIPTVCLAFTIEGIGVSQAARRMRVRPVPVFPRVKDDRILLDLRTMRESDFDEVIAAIGDARG